MMHDRIDPVVCSQTVKSDLESDDRRRPSGAGAAEKRAARALIIAFEVIPLGGVRKPLRTEVFPPPLRRKKSINSFTTWAMDGQGA
jgi:hypothetical protein